VQRIAEQVQRGKLKPGSIDERTIARYLPEPDMPDVDLFVRSSGEQRTSNFLLWQSAYAELYFTDVAWPAFREPEFAAALLDYAHRQRRFGGLSDPLVRG
jgi:undecaprenyl diphosphate synthase